MVIRDCILCDGVDSKNCPRCGGTGTEQPKKEEVAEALERAFETLDRPSEFG